MSPLAFCRPEMDPLEGSGSSEPLHIGFRKLGAKLIDLNLRALCSSYRAMGSSQFEGYFVNNARIVKPVPIDHDSVLQRALLGGSRGQPRLAPHCARLQACRSPCSL